VIRAYILMMMMIRAKLRVSVRLGMRFLCFKRPKTTSVSKPPHDPH